MFGFEKLKKERPSFIEQRANSEQLFDTSNKKPGRLSMESEKKMSGIGLGLTLVV